MRRMEGEGGQGREGVGRPDLALWAGSSSQCWSLPMMARPTRSMSLTAAAAEASCSSCLPSSKPPPPLHREVGG